MTETILRTLMYEGTMLYPYRATALKNRWRWPFGCCFPPAWSAAHPDDRDWLATAVLLEGDGATLVAVELRFLQPRGEHDDPREHAVEIVRAPLGALPCEPVAFASPPLSARVAVMGRALAPALWRVDIVVENTSAVVSSSRDEALPATLASTHVVARASAGRFVSVQDPPPALAEHARGCAGPPLWPFLLDPDDRTIVCSPIIVDDHPSIAPESVAECFDATEIDEMLVLRMLTLADHEVDEIAAGSPTVRALLERCRGLDAPARARLLGAITTDTRRPTFDAGLASTGIREGDRVRLRPRARADAFDVILRDRSATVIGSEVDFEGRRWVTVVVDGDPGADLGHAGMPGHRFFFGVEEVEPL